MTTDSCRDLSPAVSGDSVLVVQLARLGDFLQTTPLLAALGQRGERVSLLTTPAAGPLASACGMANDIFLLNASDLEAAASTHQPVSVRRALLKGLLEPVWSAGCRRILNLNISKTCANLALAWPARHRQGWRWDPEARRVLGEAWVPFVMATVANRRLTRLHLTDILASYADPPGPPLSGLSYRVPDPARAQAGCLWPADGPRVVLQLGANNDLRRWPLQHFADLARGLAEQGIAIGLVGSSRERSLGRRLGERMGPHVGRVTDLMGRTDLPTLAGVLGRADLVISCDTGTLHLATAVGARVLGLYMGPAQVHETGPYGPGHLVLQARDACGPCQEDTPACGGEASCRRLITPAAALAASLALLRGAGPEATVADLDLADGVQPLMGVHDRFGQRYRPLRPESLSGEAALALALREAGRVLLRSQYSFDNHVLLQEIQEEHLPPADGDRPVMARLAEDLDGLASAAAQGDGQAAAAVLGRWPDLRPLAQSVGAEPPPRLARACAAASEVLRLAGGL